MKRILIVDGDEAARSSLAVLLRVEGYEIDEAATEIEGMKLMGQYTHELVITDLCAPDCACMGLLQWVREHFPRVDIIIVSSYGSIDCVVRTIKAGVLNYVMKPVNGGQFLHLVRETLLRREHELKSLRRVNEPYCYLVDRVVGVSRSMEKVLETALRVTDVESGILIHGESGTGKELVARIIHNRGASRRKREFVAINCAAIPNDILESELFGYARGAFTGATRSRMGLVEVADGGTLFMDEIGDTSPQFQSKLLRVIQEKEIRRLGDNERRPVDVRIVAATNRDLRRMVREGVFREDLYYRLSVIDIVIPLSGTAGRTSSPWSLISSRRSTDAWGKKAKAFPEKPWRFSWPTPGRGTSGNSGTASSAPPCCPITGSSSLRTFPWSSNIISRGSRGTVTTTSSP